MRPLIVLESLDRNLVEARLEQSYAPIQIRNSSGVAPCLALLFHWLAGNDSHRKRHLQAAFNTAYYTLNIYDNSYSRGDHGMAELSGRFSDLAANYPNATLDSDN
jgi:hypothetical protein